MPALSSSLPPPPFQPLFTLVTDTTTRQTHHPRVHYIFADDDPEVLSDALAQYSRHQHQVQQHQLLLQKQQQQQRTSPSSSRENIRASGSGSGSNLSNRPPPPLPAPLLPAPPRAVVLDLVPRPSPTSSDKPDAATAATAGYDVAWASSLSSDWAVVSAKVGPMSSADATASAPGAQASSPSGSDDGSTPAPRLMLRIEGMGVPPPPAAATGGRRARPSSATAAAKKKPSQESMSGSGISGAAASGVMHSQDYGAIVEEFDKRMGMLRKVVDAGMERQARTAAAEAEAGDGDGEVPAGPSGVLGFDERAALSGTASTSGEHSQEEGRAQEQARQEEHEQPSTWPQGGSQPGSSGEGL